MEYNRVPGNKHSMIPVCIYLILLTYCILFKGSFSYLKACITAYVRGDMLQERTNLHLLANIVTTLNHWKNPWLMMNLLVNIVLFLPWGIFLGKRLEGRGRCGMAVAGAFGVSLSLCYELIQHFTGFGSFDVDDIVLNGAGTLGGYGLFVFYHNQGRWQLPEWLAYLFIQTVVNLIYYICDTSLHYVFGIDSAISKAAGLAVAAGLGGYIWYHRQLLWHGGKRIRNGSFIQISYGKTLCLWLAGKCLQIFGMEWIVAKWMPDGWIGLLLTVDLWIVVLLLWCWVDWAIKRFSKNETKL